MEAFYKVGDKVTIRGDLSSLDGTIKFGLNEQMISMATRICTISKVIAGAYTPTPGKSCEDGYRYRIKEDDGGNSWSSEAFAEVPCKPLFKTGDTVMVRKDLRAHDRYPTIGFCVNATMASYAGKHATITRVLGGKYKATGELDGCGYRLNIDNGQFTWACEDIIKVEDTEGFFHVGDKVSIRLDLHECESDEVKYGVAYEMEEYAGRLCTITNVRSGDYQPTKPSQDGCRYSIEEDGEEYSWSSEMFIINSKAKQNESRFQKQEAVVSRGDKREGCVIRSRRSKASVKRGHLSYKTVFGD